MEKYINFIKFSCVGVINTILSLVIYYCLKAIGFNYLISMGLGYIVTSIIGYFLNKIWVFKSDREKSIFRYYILYISALLLNLLLMKFQVSILGISDNIAPLFTLVVTTLYNYFLNKYWVFNSGFKISIKGIKKFIEENKMLTVLLVITSSILLFLFINNIYVHPVADDYQNYTLLYSFAPNGEISGIKDYLVALYNRTMDIYKTWQGTYFSNIFFSITPMLVSTNMYKFTMFMIQVFWIGSTLIFFKSIDVKKKSKFEWLNLALLFIIFSIMSIYSLGEGLYWFTGAILYILPYSLSLLLFALLIKHKKSNNKYLIPLILLMLIILGGTSYVTGLFVGFVLACLTLNSFINKEKNKVLYLVLLIVFGISFAFNVLCPGNFVRIDSYEKVSIFRAFEISCTNAYEMIKYLLFKTIFIPLFVISLPFLNRMASYQKVKIKYPIILCILCLICFVCLFMPMAYSYGMYYQETRVKNIQLFYLVLMIVFSVYCFLVDKKYNVNDFKYCIPAGCLALVVMLSSIGTHNMQGLILIDNIIYSESSSYDACMDEMSIILSSDSDEVTIKACPIYPASLHYYIPQNEGWINDTLSVYYNKKIIVEEDKNES